MRLIIILTLILSSSYTAKAQDWKWVDDGATWHYNFWNLSIVGYYEYNYTHDTLIDGQMCQVIAGERRAFIESPELELYNIQTLDLRIVYMSGDTVFYRDNDEFFVMLNFNSEIGDTWIVSTTPNEVCDDTSYVEVLGTGLMTIHDIEYETITIAPTAHSSFGFAGTFVKRFGNISPGLDPFLYPFPWGYECEALSEEAAIEWDWFGFSCFQDNSFSLYQPNSVYCDYFSTVDENELPAISVYPNPTSNYITVENTTGDTYEIIDLAGKVVQTGKLIGPKIDLLGMSEGIYFIKTENAVARFMIVR